MRPSIRKWLVGVLAFAGATFLMHGWDTASAASTGLCFQWSYGGGDYTLSAPKARMPRKGTCRVVGGWLSRLGPSNVSNGNVVGSICLDTYGGNCRATFQGTGFGVYDGLYHQVGLWLYLEPLSGTGYVSDASGETASSSGAISTPLTFGPCP